MLLPNRGSLFLLLLPPRASKKVNYFYSAKIHEMSKSPISIYYKTSPPLSFWQVVPFCRSNLPTAASVCRLSPLNLQSISTREGQKSANFNMTLNLAGMEFVFICLQVSAEEWQGVTTENNVCGDYLPNLPPGGTLQNSIIVPALFDSKTSTAATNPTMTLPQNFCLKSQI